MLSIDPFRCNRSHIQNHRQKTAASIIWHNYTARQWNHWRVPRSCRPVQSLWTIYLSSHTCVREPCSPRCSRSCLHRTPLRLPRHANHFRWTGSLTLADWSHPRFVRTCSRFTSDFLLRTVVQDIWSEKAVYVLRGNHDTCICMFPVYQRAGKDTWAILPWIMDSRSTPTLHALAKLYRI